MTILNIKLYKQCFSIEVTGITKQYIEEYVSKFLKSKTWELKKGKWIPTFKDNYYNISEDGKTYYFLEPLLHQLTDYLKNYYVRIPEPIVMELYQPRKIEIKVQEKWIPRDYQVPAIKFGSNYIDYIRKLFGLRTGRGKTACCNFSLANIGNVAVFVMKPVYIEQWIIALHDFFYLEAKDLVVISGENKKPTWKQLNVLLESALNNTLEAKIIIISNATYRNYMRDTFNDPMEVEQYYHGVSPVKFFEVLKAGVLIVDEVHQDWNFNFKMFSCSHVPYILCMSATLRSQDKFLMDSYRLVFPEPSRYFETEIKNYNTALAVGYRFKQPEHIRTFYHGNNNYNHTAFEQSIMKHVPTLKNYLTMIEKMIEHGFMKGYRRGNKCLVFVSRIEMATVVTDHLKRVYKHLDVRRYMDKDPYENVLDADIRVSSGQNCGTAIDIKKLTCTIMTVGIKSEQSNLQYLGRLREIEGVQTKFYYLYATNISWHVGAYREKKHLFKDYTTKIVELQYPNPI